MFFQYTILNADRQSDKSAGVTEYCLDSVRYDCSIFDEKKILVTKIAMATLIWLFTTKF